MGKPLLEVFAAFDPVPIGSASVACVFQAFLKNGDRVAVKVRRPGIGEKFVADCNALAAVLQFLEFFTIIRPGLSRNFVYEFRSMLMEELDFRKEARYTELFRSGVKEHMKHISAPRIYFDLSSQDIMVSEFVTGIWMRELIAAVEKNDTTGARTAQGRRNSIPSWWPSGCCAPTSSAFSRMFFFTRTRTPPM